MAAAVAAAAAHRLPPPLTAACRQRAALVCKRFAAAACTPELLRDVDASKIESLTALRSLAAWLLRHGPHVRHFSCRFPGEDEGIELATAVTSCLVAAGAPRQLHELAVVGNIRSTEWLPAMQSLERLRLLDTEAEPLQVSPTVSMLTALCSLELEGRPILLDAAARLPPSITRLRLCDSGGSMPLQASRVAAALPSSECGVLTGFVCQLPRGAASLLL